MSNLPSLRKLLLEVVVVSRDQRDQGIMSVLSLRLVENVLVFEDILFELLVRPLSLLD